MFYWLEDLWNFVTLMWKALRDTGFPWVGFFVVLACLIGSLALVEWREGNTMVKYSSEGVAVSQWSKIYKLNPGKEKSANWRDVIAADGTQSGGLVAQACYVTMISMTTIGFGDFVPSTPWGRLITVLDGIMGIILLGVLVSVLSAKLEGQALPLEQGLVEELKRRATELRISPTELVRQLLNPASQTDDSDSARR